jgi:putative tricarboxylic transport membrane protein
LINNKEVLSSAFLLIFGLFLAFKSVQLSVWSKFGPDEGFFPLAVAIIIIGLSLFLFIKALFTTGDQEKKKGSEGQGGKRITVFKITAYTVLMLVYGLLMEKVGFLITSVLFIFPIVKFVEAQSWKITFLVGLGSILISYILFVYFLGVPLPRGFIKWW